MTSYFPIPIDFKIGKSRDEFVRSSVTVFNYPNNVSVESFKNSKEKKDIFFSIYKLENYQWVKILDRLCEYGQYIDFSRRNLGISDSEPAVILTSEGRTNPQKTKYLPKPFSLRLDKSPINERASFNFSIGSNTTSYQGEIPYELTLKRKRNFLAPDVLCLDSNKKDVAYLMLLNLCNFSEENDMHEVKILDTSDEKIKDKFFIRSNSFKVQKLDFDKKGLVHFITCTSTTFIPLFITIRKSDNYQINVEHTHPPHEMFLGDGKFKILKRIKTNWIK